MTIDVDVSAGLDVSSGLVTQGLFLLFLFSPSAPTGPSGGPTSDIDFDISVVFCPS